MPLPNLTKVGLLCTDSPKNEILKNFYFKYKILNCLPKCSNKLQWKQGSQIQKLANVRKEKICTYNHLSQSLNYLIKNIFGFFLGGGGGGETPIFVG